MSIETGIKSIKPGIYILTPVNVSRSEFKLKSESETNLDSIVEIYYVYDTDGKSIILENQNISNEREFKNEYRNKYMNKPIIMKDQPFQDSEFITVKVIGFEYDTDKKVLKALRIEYENNTSGGKKRVKKYNSKRRKSTRRKMTRRKSTRRR
jgi:hypothetical protein